MWRLGMSRICSSVDTPGSILMSFTTVGDFWISLQMNLFYKKIPMKSHSCLMHPFINRIGVTIVVTLESRWPWQYRRRGDHNP